MVAMATESSDAMMEVENNAVELEWDDPGLEVANKNKLIGKIVTNKFLNRGAVKSLILRNWNPKGDVNISDLKDNMFLFNFADEEDFIRVVRDSPWTVLGNLLVLSEWSVLMTIDEIEWRKCQFWVQFHGIPLRGMTSTNIVKMGAQVGEVVAYEDPLFNDGVARSFVRARVVVSLDNPLVSGFWVPRPGLSKIWVSAKYEKLQSFCHACGRLGHEVKSCKFMKAGEAAGQKNPRYDARMGTTPVRELGRVVWIDELESQNEGEESPEEGSGRRVSSQRVEFAGTDIVGEGGVETVIGRSRIGRENSLQSNDHPPRQSTMVQNVCPNPGGAKIQKNLDIPLSKDISSIIGPSSIQAHTTAEDGLELVGGQSPNPSFEPFNLSSRVLIGPCSSSGLQNSSGSVSNNQYFVELPSEDEISGDSRALITIPDIKVPNALVNQLKRVSLKRAAEESLSSRCVKKANVASSGNSKKDGDKDTVSDCTSPPVLGNGSSKVKGKARQAKARKGVVCRKLEIDLSGLIDVPVSVCDLTSSSKILGGFY